MGETVHGLGPAGYRLVFSDDDAFCSLFQPKIYQLSGEDHGGKSEKAASVNDPVYSAFSCGHHGNDDLYFICFHSSRPGQSCTTYGVYLVVYGRRVWPDDLVYDQGQEVEIRVLIYLTEYRF